MQNKAYTFKYNPELQSNTALSFMPRMACERKNNKSSELIPTLMRSQTLHISKISQTYYSFFFNVD